MTDAWTDAFAVAGLEPKFSLSSKELDERQQGLNRAVHPDRHVTASAPERRAALARAVDVNQAIRTLRDPIERAEALLRRYGRRGEAASPKGREQTNGTDPELLMEMMEGRQRLQTARSQGDCPAIRQLALSLDARQRGLCSELGRLLDPPAVPDSAGLSQAARAVDEMRYVARFRSEVEAAIEDLE